MFSYRYCFIPFFALLTQGINQSQQNFASLNDKINENIANSLILPEVSASFEESFFECTSEFLQEFYPHFFFALNQKIDNAENTLSSDRMFLRIMAFSSIQASLCKGIIKKEKFQLVFAVFFF